MLPLDKNLPTPTVQDSYLNPNSLNSIKSMGRDKDPQAIREVAKKFEGMFVQQMLKTMRETNDVFAKDSYFNSEETRFHRDMMDQQMVINLTSGAGIGIADQFYQQMMQAYGNTMNGGAGKTTLDGVDNPAIEKGLISHTSRLPRTHAQPADSELMMPVDDAANLNQWMNDYVTMSNNSLLNSALTDATGPRSNESTLNNSPLFLQPQYAMRRTRFVGEKAGIADSPENFVALLKPHAEKAAAELNLNPDVLIAQVALETGWGKHVLHNKSGENSFNLFNIKAGGNWQGDKVNVSTLEYRGGVAAPEKADFRKYSGYAESFADYVNLIKNNPRYEQALKTGGNSSAYAEALESAGYATDPNYAEKIKRLLNTDAISAVGELGKNAQSLLSTAASAAQKILE